MPEIDPSHHIFRHVKKSWIDGDFIEPAAFRLAERDGKLEEGLSVNWVEYFQCAAPREAVAPLREILERKGRTIGGQSKFALLGVGETKAAAALYTSISIVMDEEENDPSHAGIKNYEAYNDMVAEEIAKVVMESYPARSQTSAHRPRPSKPLFLASPLIGVPGHAGPGFTRLSAPRAAKVSIP